MPLFVRPYLSLLVLSFISYAVYYFLGSKNVFFLSFKKDDFLLQCLGGLPLLCLSVVAVKQMGMRFKLQTQNVLVLFYLLIFFLLSPGIEFSLISVVTLTLIFGLHRLLPDFKISTILFLIASGALLYVPMVAYENKYSIALPFITMIIIYKSCIAFRLVSWIIDKRIYKRKEFSSFADYLEFIFCPIFFIFPGQIQYFVFNYFHSKKSDDLIEENHKQNLLVGLWGILLITIFTYMNYIFWEEIYYLPVDYSSTQLLIYHFLVGFYWLVAIYFQQAGGMAFQVSVARLIGYNFKYDMHYPLLARNPLDYLRRHSSYVRDYIVESGLKPMAIPLLRLNFNPAVVFTLCGTLSYALFIIPQTGFRPDYHRSLKASLTLLGFLSLYLVIPPLFRWIRNAPQKTLVSEVENKKLKDWTFPDYAAWIATLVLLAVSKSIFGLAMKD